MLRKGRFPAVAAIRIELAEWSSKRYRAIGKSLGIFFRIARYLFHNKSSIFAFLL